MGDHVEEHVLEQYVLQPFADGQIAGLEEHLLICGACRCRLLALEEFISVFRAVHRDLADRPIDHRHYTKSGPVAVSVVPSDGEWIASVAEEPVGRFRTVWEANLAAFQSFSQQHPNHVCQGRCDPTQQREAAAL
jgi:hypothetical protein